VIRNLDEIIESAKKTPKVVAVAAAEDPVVLSAIKEAIAEEIAIFRLFGSALKIDKLAHDVGLEKGFTVEDCTSTKDSVFRAVKSITSGDSDLLMKGHVKTGELLSVFLKDENGLKTGRTMNLVTVFQLKKYHKLLTVTDAGMVISPDLQQKMDSIVNAASVARAIGIERPKVAVLGAVETVNAKMPVTLEAAILSQMSKRGQLGEVEVDGPLALDNAISASAASHKGITGSVAGDADILIMPDIEAGNIFYKSMAFLSDAELASTIVGGKVPVILTSRADSDKTKLQSIALNVLLAGVR
jgi:phosphate butyryltransferase